MVEITENDLMELLKSSSDTIKDYILSHPGILYKGLPLAVVVWMTYPLLSFAWAWLPWLLASYEVYRFIPPGSLSWIYDILRREENIVDILKIISKKDN